MDAARRAYLERYGRDVKDKAIDAELRSLVGAAGSDADIVQLPMEIALALMLRTSAQGKSGNRKVPASPEGLRRS